MHNNHELARDLNNRKNASYWNSTRDTAIAIEALAEYLMASDELRPNLNIEVLVNGKKAHSTFVNRKNLFEFDNSVVLTGAELQSGDTKIEIRKSGKGPLYYNAYMTNFSLEDYIKKQGLEIKVNRKYYLLTKKKAAHIVPGDRGQALVQKSDKYQRSEIGDLSKLKSGDLVEVELVIESKNDYEYLIFEDMKPAGFEATEVRSGYSGNNIGAYVEYRDNRVAFFTKKLSRGKHSLTYKLRAEIPGKFSALPTQASAMYAPELRANSDEIKFLVTD